MELAGKTVIVTGAGWGIGRAIAIGFAGDGANVFGIGRTHADLQETARLCGANRMRFVVGDVTRPDDVAALVADAVSSTGRIEILVNNAALYPKVAFLESTHDDWSRVIHTNVIGMALCCRCVLPGMLEQGFGRILNVGTFAWLGSIANSTAYSASKAAVRPFTRALASEIDQDRYPDVLINEWIPGIYRTRMSDSGEDPSAAYAHARFVATLPRKGPTGATFQGSTLLVEERGVRARLRRIIGRIAGRKANGV